MGSFENHAYQPEKFIKIIRRKKFEIHGF